MEVINSVKASLAKKFQDNSMELIELERVRYKQISKVCIRGLFFDKNGNRKYFAVMESEYNEEDIIKQCGT